MLEDSKQLGAEIGDSHRLKWEWEERIRREHFELSMNYNLKVKQIAVKMIFQNVNKYKWLKINLFQQDIPQSFHGNLVYYQTAELSEIRCWWYFGRIFLVRSLLRLTHTRHISKNSCISAYLLFSAASKRD